jgi:hypothetical protein
MVDFQISPNFSCGEGGWDCLLIFSGRCNLMEPQCVYNLVELKALWKGLYSEIEKVFFDSTVGFFNLHIRGNSVNRGSIGQIQPHP